jgi:hypothetical protein
MPRSETPWVVGLGPRLGVRRESEKPGAEPRASFNRPLTASTVGSILMIENARSPAAGGWSTGIRVVA